MFFFCRSLGYTGRTLRRQTHAFRCIGFYYQQRAWKKVSLVWVCVREFIESVLAFMHNHNQVHKYTGEHRSSEHRKKRRTKSENWFVTHARRRKREVQSFDISFLYNCSHRAACVRFFFLLHRQSRFSPFFSTHTQRYGERTKKKKKNAVHGKKSLLLFLRSTVFSIWIETKKKTFSDSIVAKYKYNREKSADHCVKSACIQCVNVELS